MTAFESRCESYFSKTMEGLLTDCDVLKQLIVNRFPDVGEHDQDQWNLVSVKESHLTVTPPLKCLFVRDFRPWAVYRGQGLVRTRLK